MNTAGQGFIIPYPAISLHAVSKDLTAYPQECLYLMIDTAIMPEIQEVSLLNNIVPLWVKENIFIVSPH